MSDVNVETLKDHDSAAFRFSKWVKLLCVVIGACGLLIAVNVTLSLNVSAAPGASNTVSDSSIHPTALQNVITVTNNNDSGVGSLRQAILEASVWDTIVFAPQVSGTITLNTDTLIITKSLTIQGPGATVLAVSGGNTTSVFLVQDASLSISSLTIRDGNTSGLGGGLGVTSGAGLTLSATVVVSNAGGGISNYGSTTIINSSILSNTSYGEGAGIRNEGSLFLMNSTISGNQTLYAFSPGGGINSCCFSASTIIVNSTIANNRAAHHAGGIGIATGATLVVTNATISGNISESDGGGGLDVYGTAWIFNSTVVSNSAVSGGGIRSLSGSVVLKNSIVAANPSGGDCVGNIQSEGHNLSGSATCNFTNTGDRQNIAPQLGPLTNNGGRTPTHMLLPGSPAINAGDNTGCPANDQRSIQRPQAGICDIGAVELELPNTWYLPVVLR